jgi:hypothetical protein
MKGIKMSIETIQASKVTCQQCPATIVVADWRDARKFGWAVPSDGQMQLCPVCLENHKQRLMRSAAEIV